MPCLDRQIRIERRPTAPARGRRLPSGDRLRRDPHGQTATLLQGLVILAQIFHLILRFRELVGSRGVGLVGHQCLRGEDLSLSCHLPGNSYWRIYAPTPFCSRPIFLISVRKRRLTWPAWRENSGAK